MLTELQKKKLSHYFNVLDYDKNGLLEEDDFLAIGENLCILWGLEFNSNEYKMTMGGFSNQWRDIAKFVGKKSGHITKEEWLDFADRALVNGDSDMYEHHINKLTNELLNHFDTDRDGYISLMEYVDLFVGYRIEVRYSAKSFAKLDINKDGQVSRDELLIALRNFFKSDDPEATGNWLFGSWEELSVQ